MAYTFNFLQSNRADWIFDISATDADTGAEINFTGATVAFAVTEGGDRYQRLSATIGNGITLVSPSVIEFKFTASQMETLCAGSYRHGCVFSINGEIVQLFEGNVAVYDGEAQL